MYVNVCMVKWLESLSPEIMGSFLAVSKVNEIEIIKDYTLSLRSKLFLNAC